VSAAVSSEQMLGTADQPTPMVVALLRELWQQSGVYWQLKDSVQHTAYGQELILYGGGRSVCHLVYLEGDGFVARCHYRRPSLLPVSGIGEKISAAEAAAQIWRYRQALP
jgi:hypothetical protein